jgi:hypothetical protein
MNLTNTTNTDVAETWLEAIANKLTDDGEVALRGHDAASTIKAIRTALIECLLYHKLQEIVGLDTTSHLSTHIEAVVNLAPVVPKTDLDLANNGIAGLQEELRLASQSQDYFRQQAETFSRTSLEYIQLSDSLRAENARLREQVAALQEEIIGYSNACCEMAERMENFEAAVETLNDRLAVQASTNSRLMNESLAMANQRDAYARRAALYEDLRREIDGGSESMTHADAIAEIRHLRSLGDRDYYGRDSESES